MEDVDSLRGKPSPDDHVVELIDPEDDRYALLTADLEEDAQNLEAESWSAAVDQDYVRPLHKDAVKRQEVIYELIQTEMHHVRTLKVLLHVYLHELRQWQLLEESRLEGVFSGVEALLTLHQHLLHCLKLRQSQSVEEGGAGNNYQISQLGDLLLAQFSGALGERMKESYGVFCSRHNDDVSWYREQLQSNKKLQNLVKRIGQLPLVRRLGIPECFLLVTQRITKYPILVERIIKNTEADSDEQRSLLQALTLIKDAISHVNERVRAYEQAARLKEICLRLEPKTLGRLKDGRVFRREDVVRDGRTLLHEGDVTWKSSGRQKDVHAVLLSDVLLLLQDKDQKLVFAAVEPPVISLQKLIVREKAQEDKAMYLICASTSSPLETYEMYEVLTGSREQRVAWMTHIRDAVDCLSEEDEQDELMTRLQEYRDVLKVRDEQIHLCLTEKMQIFAALNEDVSGQESRPRGLLLRGDPSDLQQGETLLRGAIDEVEDLQQLLFSCIRNQKQVLGDRWTWRNDLEPSGSCELVPAAADDPPSFFSEEQSADDDDAPTSDCGSGEFPAAEMCDRVILLAQRLYSLQAVVAQQDSQMELQHVLQSRNKACRPYSSVLLEQEKQRNLEKHKNELADLHKLQAQHREEQQRWEKERERHSGHMEALEAQLKQRQDECSRREQQLQEGNGELQRQREDYQQGLERLRESTRAVEKDKERLGQERERLELLQDKLKKHMSVLGQQGNYDEPAQSSLSSYQSFRGSVVNGGATLTPKPLTTSDPTDVPPRVPPRRESISPQPVRAELPPHLLSTSNQVHKAAAVQQQIPTKLANVSKSRDKGFRVKGHQRTHSAASIDVNQVLPIRVSGKEGGSLRGQRSSSPQRIYQSDAFKAPASVRSVRTSQSFSTKSSSAAPPPPPPPFPKDISTPGREKVIFL